MVIPYPCCSIFSSGLSCGCEWILPSGHSEIEPSLALIGSRFRRNGREAQIHSLRLSDACIRRCVHAVMPRATFCCEILTQPGGRRCVTFWMRCWYFSSEQQTAFQVLRLKTDCNYSAIPRLATSARIARACSYRLVTLSQSAVAGETHETHSSSACKAIFGCASCPV